MNIEAISENAWERLIKKPILRKQMQMEVVINRISLFQDIIRVYRDMELHTNKIWRKTLLK